MNRAIISDISINYDGVEVKRMPFFLEIEPASNNILTDARAIAAFLIQTNNFNSRYPPSFYNVVEETLPPTIVVFDDPNYPVEEQSTWSIKVIGILDEYDDVLSVRMNNITEGVEQFYQFPYEDYVAKNVTFEINKLSPEQIQIELSSLRITTGTQVESLYDLMLPLVPRDMPDLEAKGYGKVVATNQKIIFYANAIMYQKVDA